VHVVAVCCVVKVFISVVCGVLCRWVCVGTEGLCGDWRFVWGLEVCVGTGGLCLPGCGRAVCSVGSWWRFKVLGAGGCVCVCDQASNAPDDGRMYPKHVELRIHH
jgi:hypothetical protein